MKNNHLASKAIFINIGSGTQVYQVWSEIRCIEIGCTMKHTEILIGYIHQSFVIILNEMSKNPVTTIPIEKRIYPELFILMGGQSFKYKMGSQTLWQI